MQCLFSRKGINNMYKLIHTDKNTGARAGKLRTNHGIIDTPAFMPVATKATVKTIATDELYEMEHKC